jgi:hypothetical protein
VTGSDVATVAASAATLALPAATEAAAARFAAATEATASESAAPATAPEAADEAAAGEEPAGEEPTGEEPVAGEDAAGEDPAAACSTGPGIVRPIRRESARVSPAAVHSVGPRCPEADPRRAGAPADESSGAA